MEFTISDLYMFKSCPLQFKLTKLDRMNQKIGEDDGLYAAMMSTLNYFYYKLQDGVLISMEELKAKFANIWRGKTQLYDIMHNDNKSKREKELQAIHMLHQFHRQQKHQPDQVIAVNLDFRVPFGHDFSVKGHIPLIRETPRGMEIVNFKIGKHKYNEFWQRTDMDITLQAMAFESIFKKQVDSICIHHLRTGQSFFVERKRQDYQRLYKSIMMMKKTIEQGWFYPRESYLCDKCPVQQLCMEWR
jgi:CRISPR/Cas system-associated exonuclease Cas4 (RecB family)